MCFGFLFSNFLSIMQDDMEHFADVGSLDDHVESFLSQDDVDGRDIFAALKRSPVDHTTESAKGNSSIRDHNSFDQLMLQS